MSTVDEIFDANPTKLSPEDLDKLVAELRAERAAFVKAEEENKRKGTKRTATVGTPKITDLDIKL